MHTCYAIYTFDAPSLADSYAKVRQLQDVMYRDRV